MIIAKIAPGRVEEVLVQANTEATEDLDLAVWPIVRQHLSALDRDLQDLTRRVGQAAEGNGEGGY